MGRELEQQLVDDCIAVIKENAAKVVDTVGLLKVSQPFSVLCLKKGLWSWILWNVMR